MVSCDYVIMEQGNQIIWEIMCDYAEIVYDYVIIEQGNYIM